MGYEVELIVDQDPSLPLEPRKVYKFSGDVVIPEIPSECTVWAKGNLTVGNVGGMARIQSDKAVRIKGHMHGTLTTIDAADDVVIEGRVPDDVDIISREGNIRVSIGGNSQAKLTAEKGSVFFANGYDNPYDLYVSAPNGAVSVPRGDFKCRTLDAGRVHLGDGSLFTLAGNVGEKGISIAKNLKDGTVINVQGGGIKVKGSIGERCFVGLHQGDIDVGAHLRKGANIQTKGAGVHITHNAEANSIISAPNGKVSVGAKVEKNAVIKAKDNITVGKAEPGNWCETCGDFDGEALPGAYVKANQPEIKDYHGKPNAIAKMRAQDFKTRGARTVC